MNILYVLFYLRREVYYKINIRGDSMKKRYMITAAMAGALGAGIIGYLTKKRRQSDEVYSTFENAGAPDESPDRSLSQLDNAKMVSEGSQFGVQYYNEKKAEQTYH